ncbi:hypothetical protein ROLI_005610 [Roseobacter fucihabitans]|uniref:Uncharacterized protein n=1 Tax=Roseobacter fucihabitans TaxID=1537242 RepID=A0ABZ2BNA7_9RHOB|nr:hypothetical protein [Roseobacter litoralis]
MSAQTSSGTKKLSLQNNRAHFLNQFQVRNDLLQPRSLIFQLTQPLHVCWQRACVPLRALKWSVSLYKPRSDGVFSLAHSWVIRPPLDVLLRGDLKQAILPFFFEREMAE